MTSPKITIFHVLLYTSLPRVISTLHVLFYVLLLGKSHLDFTDSLIDNLVDNGHTVDLIIARMNSHVKSNGTGKASRKFIFGFEENSPWSKTPHLIDPFLPRTRTWQEHVHYQSIVTEICEIGFSDPKLHEFIGAQKYDIGISTEYDYCGFALFRNYSIPTTVSVSSLPLLDQQSITVGIGNSPAVTQAIFETEDLTTIWGKFKNFLNWAHINWIVFPYCQKMQNDVIRKYFGENSGNYDVIELQKSIDLIFVNSNEILEVSRQISHKIKYIGGINRKKSINSTKSIIGNVDNSNGIVVFCFGTQVPSDLFPVHVKKAFAAAFRRFPDLTFFWKYEFQKSEDSEIFANITNVRFLKWLPQTELLNDYRTRAFISHVGLNSFMESSYAGVPILAIPLFTDQPHNALSGKTLGTTFVLEKSKISEDTVVEGLEAILYDERYSLNAKRISKMLRERPNPPERIFVEWIEFAAKNPLLHRNLNLFGQNMSIFEYYCLDLISICGFLLIFGVFLVVRMVKLVKIGGGKVKEE